MDSSAARRTNSWPRVNAQSATTIGRVLDDDAAPSAGITNAADPSVDSNNDLIARPSTSPFAVSPPASPTASKDNLRADVNHHPTLEEAPAPTPHTQGVRAWLNRHLLRRKRDSKPKSRSYTSSVDFIAGHGPDSPMYWIAASGFSPPGSLPDLLRDDYDAHRPPFFLRRVPKPIYKQRRRSGLEVAVNVTRVINGTFMGRDAVFVGLSVEHHVRKAKATRVTVRLATGGLGQNLTFDHYKRFPGGTEPSISQFAPKRHSGSPSAIDRSSEVGFEGGFSPGLPTVGGANLAASVARTTSTSLERRHTIRAWTAGGAQSSALIVFTLVARENPVTQDGIYDQLPIGLVIETQSRPVLLSVTVEPDEGAFNNLASGKPWSTPVYIDKTDWLGFGLPRKLSRKMDEWRQDVWAQLVDYPEEYASVSRLFSGSCHARGCGRGLMTS